MGGVYVGNVYVYDALAEDFGDTGLCGALVALSCKFEEVGNGMSQLTLVHPRDEWGKWKCLKNGNLLKAPVPVVVTPEIDMQTAGAPKRMTSVQNWRVVTGAAKADRYLYKKASGNKRGKLLPFGTLVTVTQLGAKRHKVKTQYGGGFVNIAGIAFAETVDLPDANAGIEQAQPSPAVMDQLFTISEVEKGMDRVTVKARHVFYNLMDNETSFSAADCSADEAITGVLDGCEVPVDHTGYTDTGDRRSVVQYDAVEPVAALLDPVTGVAARWDLKLVRDNWDFYLLRDAGSNRGAVVEYGNNMTGVTVKEDLTSVVTRVLPVGKDKKGKPVYIAGRYVDSPLIGKYARVRMKRIDYSQSCTEKAGFTLAQVKTELARLAALEFSQNKIDQPVISANVKFLNLGDTDEYAQYRGLDRMYLFDTVRIIHKKMEIDLDAQVVRVAFDVLAGRFIEMDIGTVRVGAAGKPIPAYRLPEKIDGSRIADGSLGADKLGAGSVTDDHLQDGVVQDKLISGGGVTSTALGADSVTNRNIADGSIAQDKLAGLTGDLDDIRRRLYELENPVS